MFGQRFESAHLHRRAACDEYAALFYLMAENSLNEFHCKIFSGVSGCIVFSKIDDIPRDIVSEWFSILH